MSSTILNVPPSSTVSAEATMDAMNCGDGGGADTFFGLRVASIFVILFASVVGALFPVLVRQSSWLHVPKGVFDFAKYFGSGVIIATAFIHLLSPAIEELESPCLPDSWREYPFALLLCLISILAIFVFEVIAFRVGTAKLAELGIHHDSHREGSVAHGPEGGLAEVKYDRQSDDLEARQIQKDLDNSASTEIIGIAILEFGIVLHSVLIGLTLAVAPNFKVLFVVLVFHQMFEGLGVGSRLAYLKLPKRYNYVPIFGAILYAITTPVGIAVGLGIKSTYNANSTTASVVSGVLDSLSAGILIYTGVVELLAHEFLFNDEMMSSSRGKIAYIVVYMLLGSGIMALLGKWA